MNVFRDLHYEQLAIAYAADSMNPKPVAEKRNRRYAEPGRLRITKGEKLGNAQYSHAVDGRELAEIEDVNATLRELSGQDFEIDKFEPRGLNYLTRNEMKRAYESVMLLHLKGLNFNIWYTCNWKSLQITTDEEVEEANRRHVESLRHRLKDEGAEFFCMWVLERGKKRGLHTHLLLHLPKSINLKEFERQVSQSLFTITGMYPRCPDPKLPKRPKKAKRVSAAGTPAGACGFRLKPATDSEMKPVAVPI